MRLPLRPRGSVLLLLGVLLALPRATAPSLWPSPSPTPPTAQDDTSGLAHALHTLRGTLYTEVAEALHVLRGKQHHPRPHLQLALDHALAQVQEQLATKHPHHQQNPVQDLQGLTQEVLTLKGLAKAVRELGQHLQLPPEEAQAVEARLAKVEGEASQWLTTVGAGKEEEEEEEREPRAAFVPDTTSLAELFDFRTRVAALDEDEEDPKKKTTTTTTKGKKNKGKMAWAGSVLLESATRFVQNLAHLCLTCLSVSAVLFFVVELSLAEKVLKKKEKEAVADKEQEEAVAAAQEEKEEGKEMEEDELQQEVASRCASPPLEALGAAFIASTEHQDEVKEQAAARHDNDKDEEEEEECKKDEAKEEEDKTSPTPLVTTPMDDDMAEPLAPIPLSPLRALVLLDNAAATEYEASATPSPLRALLLSDDAASPEVDLLSSPPAPTTAVPAIEQQEAPAAPSSYGLWTGNTGLLGLPSPLPIMRRSNQPLDAPIPLRPPPGLPPLPVLLGMDFTVLSGREQPVATQTPTTTTTPAPPLPSLSHFALSAFLLDEEDEEEDDAGTIPDPRPQLLPSTVLPTTVLPPPGILPSSTRTRTLPPPTLPAGSPSPFHLSNTQRVVDRVFQGPRLEHFFYSWLKTLRATGDPALIHLAHNVQHKYVQGTVPIHQKLWGPALFAVPVMDSRWLRLYNIQGQPLKLLPRTIEVAKVWLREGKLLQPDIPFDRTEKHMLWAAVNGVVGKGLLEVPLQASSPPRGDRAGLRPTAQTFRPGGPQPRR